MQRGESTNFSGTVRGSGGGLAELIGTALLLVSTVLLVAVVFVWWVFV